MSGCHCPLWRFLLALNPSRLSFLEIFDESRAYNAEFVGIHSNTVHSATWIIPTVASSDTSTGPHHSAPPVNCRFHLLMLAVFLQDWFRWTGRIPDGNKTRPGGWSTTEDARFDRWQAVSPSRLTQYLMFMKRRRRRRCHQLWQYTHVRLLLRTVMYCFVFHRDTIWKEMAFCSAKVRLDWDRNQKSNCMGNLNLVPEHRPLSARIRHKLRLKLSASLFWP